MANLKNTSITNANSIKLPVGTEGERPGNSQGRLRYNTSRQTSEIYSGSDWIDTQVLPGRRQARVAQIPLISTGVVDNSSSITRRDVFGTSPTFNTGPFTFSSSGVTVTEPGYYQVYTNCFFERTSGERTSSSMSFFVNNERQNGISNSSFMRNSIDNRGGNTLSSIFLLESGDEVGLGFSSRTGRRTPRHSLVGNSSAFYIMKLDTAETKFGRFNGSRNTNVNNQTSFVARDYLQHISDDRNQIEGDINVLGIADLDFGYIEVTQPGIYEIHAHCFFQITTGGDNDGGFRWSPGFRFAINGSALPYISDSAYKRNFNNHDEASSNLKVLQSLSAGDRITLQFRQEAEANSSTNCRLIENDSIFTVRKID